MIAARRAAWIVPLTSACFHPVYDRPTCGAGGECPSGLTCNLPSNVCERPGSEPVDAGSDAGEPVDAIESSVDGAIDSSVQPLCLGTFVRVCVSPPVSPIILMTQTLDTSSSTLCQPYTATPTVDACVIAGQSIAIPSGSIVTVTGTRRLILLSTGSLTVDGVLDASSDRASQGPAADTGPCSPATRDADSGTAGGGGWGGSFGNTGNNGGSGGVGGGTGGIAAPAGNVTALTGGCPGGTGGNNSVNGGGGARGRGGGAVLLAAAQTIEISGTVNASGGGGGGGATRGGGGGGGTGGMIVLEAASVRVLGECFANGGAGGEGAELLNGRAGGESPAPDVAARGGMGGSAAGGAGGDGSVRGNIARPGANGDTGPNGAGGGGGAGGGAGVIKVFAGATQGLDDPNKVSPPPS